MVLKLLCNFHTVSCRIKNLAWNPLCYLYKFICNTLMYCCFHTSDSSESQWYKIIFSLCTVHLPISSVSECIFSVLSDIGSADGTQLLIGLNVGVHLLQIFRPSPSILQEAEKPMRRLEMLLSNYFILKNASERFTIGRQPWPRQVGWNWMMFKISSNSVHSIILWHNPVNSRE